MNTVLSPDPPRSGAAPTDEKELLTDLTWLTEQWAFALTQLANTARTQGVRDDFILEALISTEQFAQKAISNVIKDQTRPDNRANDREAKDITPRPKYLR